MDGDWATTSVDYRAEEDLARLFESHGLPPPNVALAARSALSLIVALAYSDLLAMLPQQWEGFPLTRDALQVIRVEEALPAPEIVLIQRSGVPLTPAAEFLCDVLLRQAPGTGHNAGVAVANPAYADRSGGRLRLDSNG